MPATIKDIARRAGVSHSTVSRALSGSPLISASTADRVRKAALELGYLPSAAARSLKTNRSLVIGAVVSSMDDPFFAEILQGIEDVAQACGYSLFVTASLRDPDRQQQIVQALVERRADGIILCSTSFSAEQGRQLLQYGRPIVAVNNQAAEDYRFSIYHDDRFGSRQITRHLIELGHRKIAYLGNASSGRTTADRLAGFSLEMQAHGLEIHSEYVYEVPGGSAEHGLEASKHFIDLPVRPTALVCFNDMMAIGVLQGLQQAGIRVPEELSVAGFDNIAFSAFTNPPLTTFDQPKRYIGAEAARLVLGLLNEPPENDQARIRILQGKLLVRGSTGPARLSG